MVALLFAKSEPAVFVYKSDSLLLRQSFPSFQRSFLTEEIIAMDGGNRSSKVELRVTITSAENQPPQWERDSYEVVIPENTTRDTSVVVSLGFSGGS